MSLELQDKASATLDTAGPPGSALPTPKNADEMLGLGAPYLCCSSWHGRACALQHMHVSHWGAADQALSQSGGAAEAVSRRELSAKGEESQTGW